MRISTSMIFDKGVSAINNQTSTLLHTQQQIASNTRILKPSDDPVAAARALEVTQARSVVTQFNTNVSNAQSALGLEESQLSSTNDLLTRVRELAVQAGNASLSASDRKSIATEMRARFDELLGVANATDSNGEYLFAGYMGSTKPFAASVDAMIANPALDVTYLGDAGQRRLQVSAARQIEVSDAGSDVFMNVRQGNGYFTTDYAAGNTGSGVMSVGSITNPTAWAAAPTQDVSVRFWTDPATSQTYYDLVDPASGNSMFTNAASTTGAGGTFTHAYTAGASIPLSGLNAAYGTDMGASITVTGAPASGDSFNIAPSSNASIFRDMADLIGTLENGTPGAKYTMDLANALQGLSQGSDKILTVRAAIGSRLNELDFLSNVNSDLDIQYQQTLSNLQDLDYTKAISDLTRQQTNLQAAQLSFTKISSLSLFDYIK